MKLTKSDCTLNERDALLDVLASEKQLMAVYTTALFESSAKAIRKNFSTNLLAVAENQYCIFMQMNTRGYYEPKPADKDSLDTANASFKKQKNALKGSG